VLTATEVNQPQIFPPFYTRQDPEDFLKTRRIGYDIFVPEEYSRYDPGRERILYAVHPRDLPIFEDYELLKTVIAPGGQIVYHVIHPLRRKRFVNDWITSEPLSPDLHEVPDELREPRLWRSGRPIHGQFVYADLNRTFPGNPEWMCVVAAVELEVRRPVSGAWLECVGSEDRFSAQLHGKTVMPEVNLTRQNAARAALPPMLGTHTLTALSCETVGDWYFGCSIVDADGRSIDAVESRRPRTALP
jgi:hypothetical protein